MISPRKVLLPLLFAGLAASGGEQGSSAEASLPIQSFHEHLSNMKAVVGQGLSAIGRPVPNNPFDVGSQEYAIHVKRFENDQMKQMDAAVKRVILEGFQSGMTLDETIASTRGDLTWSEWPTSFARDDITGVRGVTDVAMSDAEWLATNNEVVVLYKTHVGGSGTKVHFFQNSFRTFRKDSTGSTINMRECPSSFVVVVNSDGTVHAGSLYRESFVSPRGNGDLGLTPRLLGFLSVDPESVPIIMISTGPSGRVMNFGISCYAWNRRYNVWEGAGFWSSERVLTYSYDGGTTNLTYFQCIEKPPEGPNTYGCMETVNLREYYLQHKDEIESSRAQNVRIGGTLTPPKEMYVEPPKSSEAIPE